MHTSVDLALVDKIVDEVKSQGVFDQFRKDSMADVDTKPAYQNLRQRVETIVSKFLSEQIWTPELNKIQLREKLRKHITDIGFLDTGVERIVDQVVDPKIAIVFKPKVEDISYKYLGIEKPETKILDKVESSGNDNLFIKTDLLPTDLEAVSPDSEKASNKSESNQDFDEEEKDDFESPAFEPLEPKIQISPQKVESNQSHLSCISGLTSNDTLSSSKHQQQILKNVESPESNLSEVSSNSQLSAVTNEENRFKERSGVDISEEAQMPQFDENSVNDNKQETEYRSFHFDIKKEEIKFEGTERKSDLNSYNQQSEDSLKTEEHSNKSQNDFNTIPKNENSSICSNAASSSSQSLNSKNELEQELKNHDTYKTDTKINEKYIKDIPNNKSENSFKQQSICSTKSTLKYDEKSQSSSNKHRQHYKSKSSEKQKKSKETDHESIRTEKHSPRSSPRTVSPSKSHKSKYESKRKSSKVNKEKLTKSHHKTHKKTSKKSKSSKEKNEDDHFFNRSKGYRKRSTDSNDDSSKDGFKGSLSHIHRSQESKENSTKTDFSGNKSNNNAVSYFFNEQTQKADLENDLKPIILDKFLGSTKSNQVELVIGNSFQVENKIAKPNMESKILFNNNIKLEDEFNVKDIKLEKDLNMENTLKYFDIKKEELERTEFVLNQLSEFINKDSPAQNIYLLDCNNSFKNIFEEISCSCIHLKSEKIDKDEHDIETENSNISIMKSPRLTVSNNSFETFLMSNNIIPLLNGERVKDNEKPKKTTRNHLEYRPPKQKKRSKLAVDCNQYNNVDFKEPRTITSPSLSELSSKENNVNEKYQNADKKIEANLSRDDNQDGNENKTTVALKALPKNSNKKASGSRKTKKKVSSSKGR